MHSMSAIAAAACTAIAAAVAPGSAAAAPCAFKRTTLSFAGTPSEQAHCLLKPVARYGKLGPASNDLPPTLRRVVGTAAMIDCVKMTNFATSAGTAPARYFFILDTSAPWFDDRPFPVRLDSDANINDASRFLGRDAVAHAFMDRTGCIAIENDFSRPWRATKLEKVIGGAAKGLLLHVENVQPRRRGPPAARATTRSRLTMDCRRICPRPRLGCLRQGTAP